MEVFASGPALARRGRDMAEKNPSSKLAALVDGKLDNISAETVFLAADGGDPEARKVFDEMGFYLGIGISNLINLFNPERIILCGRVSQAYRFFGSALARTIEEKAWHISEKEIKVSTIDNTPALGAAGNVLQAIYNGGLLFEKKTAV